MAEAQTKLREFTTADGHVFLPDDVSFTELGLRSMQDYRQWTDAYLLHWRANTASRSLHLKAAWPIWTIPPSRCCSW